MRCRFGVQGIEQYAGCRPVEPMYGIEVGADLFFQKKETVQISGNPMSLIFRRMNVKSGWLINRHEPFVLVKYPKLHGCVIAPRQEDVYCPDFRLGFPYLSLGMGTAAGTTPVGDWPASSSGQCGWVHE